LAGNASGGPDAGMYCTHDGDQAGKAPVSARNDAAAGLRAHRRPAPTGGRTSGQV